MQEMSAKKDLHVVLRRSRSTDAAAIAQLTRLGTVVPCVPPLALFPWRTEADFLALIERSVMCITATSTITGEVAGFVCLDDIPHVTSILAEKWENTLKYNENNNDGDDTDVEIAPYNTLWLKSLLAPPSSAFLSNIPDPNDLDALRKERKLLLFGYEEEDMILELLSTALINMPGVMQVLVPFPLDCKYPPIECLGKKSISLTDCFFEGLLLRILASKLVPRLQLRLGIMEDYDDFVPDLLRGYGLITALPEEFYLDELLKDQDDFHKVIIAEDAVTHHVVGIMCLEATIEDQQKVSRQYMTEMFDKLRPMNNRQENEEFANLDTPNVVKISFFQIDPQYAMCADQFLPFIFQEFPYVEYAMIILPHEKDEPPFLQQFEHVPLRRYHPRNAKGEVIPIPQGLWIYCRYAADPIWVQSVLRNDEVGNISAFVEESFLQFSQQNIATLLEDIRVSIGGNPSRENLSQNTNTFMLQTRLGGKGEAFIVGVASTRRVTVGEMYALRANYAVDVFVNYYVRGPRDYSETDIHLNAEAGRRKFFRGEMQAVMVRCFYIKPVYRCHVPFFVREILRHTNCEVALVLEDGQASPFPPLLRQLLRAPPRRVQEKTPMTGEEMGFQEGDKIGGKDPVALGCLFVGTRRIIGDRKKMINTRIIIVGAGSTGLACIHRFLSVPYVHFRNIVLVSTDGMPTHPNQQSLLWFADHMELLEREQMGLIVGNPVRVVHGLVTDVDTTQKYVSIDDGTYEPYDYVILTTGRQYVVPNSICSLQQLIQQPQSHNQRGFVPQGTLALSGESSVEKLRQHLHDLDRNPHNISNVIVYGSGLDAFATATSILSLGFSPQRIVVVSPETSNPFLDKDAFDCAVKLCNSLGINTLRGYGVTRLEYDDDGSALTTVVVSPVLISEEGGDRDNTAGISNSVELGCSLIVCCEDKDIDSHVLSTLNRRSIVFDGRVIVESNYRTTDKCVYAAGPVAMFTRRYGTTPGFEDFNTRDVGTSLAEILLGVFGLDEFADKNAREVEDKEEEMAAAQNQLYTRVLQENGSKGADFLMDTGSLSTEKGKKNIAELQKNLPSYNSPVASRIRLPVNYVFFCTRSIDFNPERCLRLCYSNIEENKPIVTVMEDLVKSPSISIEDLSTRIPEQNLFVIYIDEQTHLIDAVMYFGNGAPEMHNYMCLIGMPQSLLNLIYRYEEARINNRDESSHQISKHEGGPLNDTGSGSGLNLLEYLRLPKLQIFFYDRFTVFYRELREKMRDHKDLIDAKAHAFEFLTERSSLSEECRRRNLKELTAEGSSFARQVQYELIKFLQESKDYLPQIYFLPDIRSHVQ
ncbi:hypothetical protein MOQ_001067 [Trypanosoma cruzi marinkellei]|uniref:Cilia- and flagella-associated protein 61 N-terminal domain-containing protein n=1 Tax=Trypanosoma cruzi marinkellei TaxID=85056 RepID=K2PCE0_TRYCR|nr:hypothetical protein MOQ_001067 [Trypanosoma cruzi marinkellei]